MAYAREQRQQHNTDFHRSVKLPTVSNLDEFLQCPEHLRAGAVDIFETAAQLLQQKYPGSLSDKRRTSFFCFSFQLQT